MHSPPQAVLRAVSGLACLVLLWTAPAAFAGDDVVFRHFSTREGLSQSRVAALYHAPDGFLWVGTQDGLNRFDGYEFRVYRHDPEDIGSLADNQINVLTADSRGRLLVGSRKGLNRYRAAGGDFDTLPVTDGVQALLADPDGSLWVGTALGVVHLDAQDRATPVPGPEQGPAPSQVRALYRAPGGVLWAGGMEGLYRLDAQGRLQPFDLPGDAAGPAVTALQGDGAEGLWVGTTMGLYHVSPPRPVMHYVHDPADPDSPADDYIQALYRDDAGRLWVGTDKAGAAVFEGGTGPFHHYRETGEPGALTGKGVWSFAPDPHGGLWLGTFGGGVNRVDADRLSLQIDRHEPDGGGLSNNHVLHIFRDSRGTLWVGTDNGLNRARPEQEGFDTFFHDPAEPTSLGGNAVTSITEDRWGQIWLGVWSGGLHRLRPDGMGFDHIPRAGAPVGLASKTVICLLPTRDDTLWVGTNKGLNAVDIKTEAVTTVTHEALAGRSIFSLSRDGDRGLWVGTRNGLARLETETTRVTLYHERPAGRRPSHDVIIAFHHDRRADDVLWIATAQGLNRMNTDSETFTSFHLADGLPNETIYGILEDDWERLWISTSKGLVVTDKKFENCRIFDARDGLPGSEFNAAAFYRDSAGRFYFGAHDGLVRLNPSTYDVRPAPVPVLLTDFLLNNTPARPKRVDPDSPLPAAVETIDALNLTHRHPMIGFGFAAAEFTAPWHVRYRYRMEGFDRDWIETDTGNRRATYTNLPPGSYRFQVQAAGPGGGFERQTKSVAVHVAAPPWRTWWAKSLYALVLLGLLGVYVYLQRQKLAHEREMARRQRQLAEKDRATAARLMEIDKLKDAFLANTSHELRTPLNGIIGLADGILADTERPPAPNHRRDLTMIVGSGRRLATLINDILDFSSLRRGELQLHLAPVDLVALVDAIVALNRPLVGQKDVVLINAVTRETPPVVADEARLGQILHNLIGNAVKFTPQGTVTVSAEALPNRRLRIAVRDTGIGIPPEARTAIFEAFRQADGGVAREYGGTGLGLAITRRLIKLHDSAVELESRPGEGSEFAFQLPISDTAPTDAYAGPRLTRLAGGSSAEAPEEAADAAPIQDEPADTDTAAADDAASTEPRTALGAGFHILVVDDEAVNRRVLVNYLRPRGFRITECASGAEAVAATEADRPDLILLDIMMPGMSGYEVCRTLRTKLPMEELPILFLTARNRVDDMVAGFKAGANDFLAKPVAREELLTRLHTHLQLLDANRDLERKVQARSQALITSQKVAGVGTLARGLAHEINNPNNFVGGCAQVLQEMLEELKEEQEQGALLPTCKEWQAFFKDLNDQVQLIYSGSRRISEVIEQLRLFTAGSAKGRQLVDLRRILETMVHLTDARFDDTVFVLEDGEPCPYTCCPGEMSQVFLNILTNAAEAVARRRAAGDDTPGRVEVLLGADRTHLVCSIADNGIGISPEERQRLFDAFFTTKAGNVTAGLGLYTAWEVVADHGGQILVPESPAPGSRFDIYLPLARTDTP